MKCNTCGETEVETYGTCADCAEAPAQTVESVTMTSGADEQAFLEPALPPAAPPVPASYDRAVLLYGQATPAQQSFLQYGKVSVGMTTFLCIITLGIYYLIWIYKNMKVYRALSGRAGANLEQLFWGLVIAIGLTILFSWTLIGAILLGVAIVALQLILTSQMLDDRQVIGQRYGFANLLPSKGYTMTILACALISPYLVVTLLITLPLFIWYLVVFFRGHNVVVDGIARASLESSAQ